MPTSPTCWPIPQVDLVDLCVPNDEHARLAIRALEAGKHVLVEKPIALTTADADAMVAASQASGKLLMVGARAPVLPRVRLRGRGRAVGPLREAPGRAPDAGDRQARLVERDRRRRPERGPGDRPAHPRHAFHRPGLRRPPGRPFAGRGRGGGGRPPGDPVSLRRPQPGRLGRLRGVEPGGAVVRARVRVLPRAGDAGVRVRQSWGAKGTWPPRSR